MVAAVALEDIEKKKVLLILIVPHL